MNNQIWRIIEDYPDYEVSNEGLVRNVKTKRNSVVCKNKGGYGVVHLKKDGKCYTPYVHRLVALAFIPNTENLPQINHKDENKLNNRVENLEWCTNQYNCNYGTRNRRISENKKRGVNQ